MAYNPNDDDLSLAERLAAAENHPQVPDMPEGPGYLRQKFGDTAERTKERAKEEVKSRAGSAAKKGIRQGAQKAAQQGAGTAARTAGSAGAEAVGGGAASGAGGAAGAAGAAAGGAATGAAGAAGTAGAAGAAGTAGAGAAAGAAAGTAGAAAATGAAAGTAATTGALTTATGATGVGLPVAGAVAIGGAAATAGIAAAPFLIKHRVGVAVTIVVLFLSAMVAGLFLISPLKKDTAMLQTTKKVFSPLQTIVELRSVPVLANFVVGGSTASQQASLPQAAGKAGQLYTAMRELGFERSLKEKYDLEFTPGSSGAVKVVSRGVTLGEARTGDQAKALLDKSSSLTSIIKNEMHSWDWAQHAKIAQPAKTMYQNPRLNIPGADSASTTEETTNLVKYQLTTTTQPVITNIRNAMTCMLGGGTCNANNIQPSITATGAIQEKDTGSLVAASQKAYDNNVAGITPENGYQVPTLRDSAQKDLSALLTQQTLPLLSWLDIGSVADLGSTDPAYKDLPVGLRQQQAGGLFLMSWIGTSQGISGDINNESANILSKSFAQMESSQAYNYVAYGTTNRGTPLADHQKINSMAENPMQVFTSSWKAANPELQESFGLFGAWNQVAKLPIIGHIITLALQHPFINIAGEIFTNSPLAIILKNLPLVGNFFTKLFDLPLSQVLATSFGMSSDLLINECDISLRSFQYFNCVVMGSQDLYMRICEQEFGCGDLNPAQLDELKNFRVAADKSNLAATPLYNRIFDVYTPNSFASMAVLRSPLSVDTTQNVASFFNGMSKMITNIPSTAASIFSGQVKAADGGDATSIGGIANNKGVPLSKLKDAPLSSEVLQDTGVCPEKQKGIDNICYSDTAVIDSLLVKYKTYRTL